MSGRRRCAASFRVARLDHYFAVMLGSVGGHYRPEDVQIGNYAGTLEALNGGRHDDPRLVAHQQHPGSFGRGHRGASRASGIRAVYAHGVPTGGEWWAFSELEHPEDIRRIRRRTSRPTTSSRRSPSPPARRELELRGREARLGAGQRSRNPDQRPRRDAADRRARQPREEHLRSRPAGTGHDVHPLHRLDRRGAGPDRRVGRTASVAPYVEMLMGHGHPPTGKLLARGIRPSLSVDVVSSVPGEMFTQMRTALVTTGSGSSPTRRTSRSSRACRTRTCSSSRRSTAPARAASRTRSDR